MHLQINSSKDKEDSLPPEQETKMEATHSTSKAPKKTLVQELQTQTYM